MIWIRSFLLIPAAFFTILPPLVLFCTRDNSDRSMDNYYFQQAIHLSDTAFSIDSMNRYYNDFLTYLKDVLYLGDMDAASVRNDVFYDTLHWLIGEYDSGNPTRNFYREIEDDRYVHGWKDCEPTLAEIGEMIQGQILDKSGYSYKYVLSDSVLYNRPAYLVNFIDRRTDSVIKNGRYRFGYSSSQARYIGYLRY
jgi:hypothetical protein